MKTIFEFLDYRPFLRQWIKALPRGGRGEKSKLAHAMGSPPSHISQVLAEKTHFSMEQAASINEYLSHPYEEAQFFLLLVEFGRAGTPALRAQLRERIAQILASRDRLKRKLSLPHQPNEQVSAQYYSEWQVAAVHMLLTIPGVQSEADISTRLRISSRKVRTVLEFLLKHGFVRREQNGKLCAVAKQMHLDDASPWINRHHANWRQKSIEMLGENARENELRYSGAVTLSHEDFGKVKAILMDSLRSALNVIRESPEKDLACLTLDWIRLTP